MLDCLVSTEHFQQNVTFGQLPYNDSYPFDAIPFVC